MSDKWQERVGVVRAIGILAILAVLFAIRLSSPQRPSGQAVPPRAPALRPLRIAAAADLRYALDDIIAGFRTRPRDTDPEPTYGSSGTLAAQIINGAPFDLFLSADRTYAQQLEDHDLAEDPAFHYATGRLAVWVAAASPLDVDRAGIRAVADPRVGHVAIANPTHAPYGRAAVAAMRAAGVYAAAEPKLALGENVAQAFQFVQSGAADIGIVAASLVVAPSAKSGGRYVIVPADLHPALEQSGVVLRNGHVADARAFRSYLLSDVSRAVLKRYGFDPAEP